MSARSDVDPLHVFRFRVEFAQGSISGASKGSAVLIGDGAFAEVTGLEATMEPRVIKEGGRNVGNVQRVGPVTFGTVVLKRGLTRGQDLWTTFSTIAGGAYSVRLDVTITLLDTQGRDVTYFSLRNALPVKIKMADLNARAAEVGVEELHLACEGVERRGAS